MKKLYLRDDIKTPEEKRWVAYCDKCGKPFWSDETVRISYPINSAEYGNYEEVSPCCGADFSDYPPEEKE